MKKRIRLKIETILEKEGIKYKNITVSSHESTEKPEGYYTVCIEARDEQKHIFETFNTLIFVEIDEIFEALNDLFIFVNA